MLFDGYHVAGAIRRDNPEAFALLTTEPLRYGFAKGNMDFCTDKTVIELDREGHVASIGVNDDTIQTLAGPPERVGVLYRPWKAFVDATTDPANQIRFMLEAGDALFFDNRRVLHARETSDPHSRSPPPPRRPDGTRRVPQPLPTRRPEGR